MGAEAGIRRCRADAADAGILECPRATAAGCDACARRRAEFDALSAQLAQQYPQTNAKIGAQVVPLRAHLVGSFRDVLPLLFGAAAILLVVACANVANLLLARGRRADASSPSARRSAPAASRLVRQMLVESLLLATAGGVVGLLLARWILDTIAALRPGDIALVDRIPIDGRAAVDCLRRDVCSRRSSRG